MIPIMKCKDKQEAKRMERRLIRRWKPSLNSEDIPFWLIKNYKGEYNKQTQTRKRRVRTPPWNGEAPYANNPLPLFAKYDTEKEGHTTDLAYILSRNVEGTVTVNFTPGQIDTTKWDEIKQLYGASSLVCTMHDDRWRGTDEPKHVEGTT